MKRIYAFLFVIAALFSAFRAGAVFAGSSDDPAAAVVSGGGEVALYPQIVSNNAIVVYSVGSKQTLYANRKDEAVSPAAVAKLLSMMVAYDIFKEKGVDAKSRIVETDAYSLVDIGMLGDKSTPMLGLSAGDSNTAEELMGAALLANANDACNAICYYCATELLNGTLDDFINRMNGKAKEIGASDSVFKNTTGAEAEGMVTTPGDAAKIAAAFYEYNDLLNLCDKDSMLFGQRSNIHTKNYLLSDALLKGYKNKHAIGIIAGQRCDTEGYMLITAVESDGLAYVIAVMEAAGEIRKADGTREFGPNNAYDDMKILIEWTRESFKYQVLAGENELIDELRVEMGKNLDVVQIVPERRLEILVNKGVDLNAIDKEIHYEDGLTYESEFNGDTVRTIKAPIKKGQVVGRVDFLYNGEKLDSVNLIVQSAVESSKFLSVAGAVGEFLFSGTMMIILIVIGAVIVFYAVFAFTAAVVRGVRKARKK